MIRTAICDDNKVFLSVLKKMTEQKLNNRNMVYEMDTFLSGTVFLDRHRIDPYDVVFLDILMPGMNGFEVAKEIRRISEKTYIIFVTTEKGLVYDSFDFTPFYFISKEKKEILDSRLSHVIEKLDVHLTANKKICIEMSYGDIKYVEPVNIVSVQSKANYIDYYLSDSEHLHVRGKLEDALRDLPKTYFVRVHNRTVINMAHIRRVDFPNNIAIMKEGREIAISRTYKKDFDEAYAKYLRDFN